MKMTRREQLAFVVGLIENAKPNSIAFTKAVEFAKDCGITPKLHEGRSEQWFNDFREVRVAEWLMGQFLDMDETKNYIACNSAINISMSFLHGTY